MFFSGDGSHRAVIGKVLEAVPGTYGQKKFQNYILYKESDDISCSRMGLPAKY
mgnify:CR=1